MKNKNVVLEFNLNSEEKVKIFRNIFWYLILKENELLNLLKGSEKTLIRDLDLEYKLFLLGYPQTIVDSSVISEPEKVLPNSKNFLDREIFSLLRNYQSNFVWFVDNYDYVGDKPAMMLQYWLVKDLRNKDFVNYENLLKLNGFENSFSPYFFLNENVPLDDFPPSLLALKPKTLFPQYPYWQDYLERNKLKRELTISEDVRKSYLDNFTNLDKMIILSNLVFLLEENKNSYFSIFLENKLDLFDLYLLNISLTDKFLELKEGNPIPYEWLKSLINIEEEIQVVKYNRDIFDQSGFWDDKKRIHDSLIVLC